MIAGASAPLFQRGLFAILRSEQNLNYIIFSTFCQAKINEKIMKIIFLKMKENFIKLSIDF